MEHVIYKALDRCVLAVAVINEHDKYGDWAAYIGAVPGENHEIEKESVAAHGTKLSKKVAELYFGGTIEIINKTRTEENKELLYWRD